MTRVRASMTRKGSEKRNGMDRVPSRSRTMTEYVIHLRARPGPTAPAIRLRRLLKLALRGFGMICTNVAEIPAGAG
jgi:hypothetical protein